MKMSELQTPSLVVKESVFEKNEKKLFSMLKGEVKLRPHFKSNKCTAIALKQLKDGAVGITCAKLSAAVVLADAGVNDILIANQVVQKEKLPLLAKTAKKCHLTVCVDNEENIKDISAAAKCEGSTVHTYIEYEVGMNRCGVDDDDEVLRLAKLIETLPNITFDGIQAYAGQLSHEESAEIREKTVAVAEAKLTALKDKLNKNGIEVKKISGGSTGTSVYKFDSRVYNELQCGSYLFMDTSYNLLKLPFEQSLFVLATVIHTDKNKVVLDAGVKSFGMDQHPPVLLDYPEIPLVFSEEHCQFELENNNLKLNDKMLIIPGHCCTTINTFDEINFVNDDGNVVRTEKITGRGKAQ